MYVNHGAKRPYHLSQNDLLVGFDNTAVEYINGKLTCSFSRANKMPKVPNYFDLSMSYYLLFASGSLNSSSKTLILLNEHLGFKNLIIS